MWAAGTGWERGVEILLNAGANPRSRSLDGFTPLNFTSTRNFVLTRGAAPAPGPSRVFRQPAPHPGFDRAARILRQQGAL